MLLRVLRAYELVAQFQTSAEQAIRWESFRVGLLPGGAFVNLH